MNCYTTETLKTTEQCPRNLRNKSCMDIILYLREHFNTDMYGKPQNQATRYMQAVSRAIFDPTNWKNPCYIRFASPNSQWIMACIIWYHGRQPESTMYGIYSRGYACD